MVLKEELLNALWPDVTVEEGNLSKLVFLLRRLLAADPSWSGSVETIPKRGYRLVGPVERRALERSTAVSPAASTGWLLAVLPFSDPNASDQHLSEGLAERILNHLVKVAGLSVLARASSFRFGMGAHDLPAVGRQLGVGLLVDGRFQRMATGFEVTARLFEVGGGVTLWSSDMKVRAEDLLLLDTSIASAVVEALGLSLPAPLPRSSSPQALEKVVQARYFWNRRPGDVVTKAIRCYQEALALDPNNAEAWAGLADVYVTLGSWEAGVLPHAEGQSKAMVHASRALALDPTLAEAHATLGYAALHYSWDVGAAETSFRSALGLNAQCVTAHHWYSHCLAAAGRVQESLEESRECLRLDPMNLLMSVHLAWHHHMAREPDQVVFQAERVVAMDPSYHWGHYFRAWGLEGIGDHLAALRAAREGERVASGNPVMMALVGRAHAMAGQAREGRAIIRKLEEAGGEHLNFAYEIALIHLGLGERGRALHWLQQARQHRSGWMAYLTVDPRLDPLRSEKRFAALRTDVALKISEDGGRPSGPRR